MRGACRFHNVIDDFPVPSIRPSIVQRPGTGCLACDAGRMSEWWAATAHLPRGQPPPFWHHCLSITMDKQPTHPSHAIARSVNCHAETEKVPFQVPPRIQDLFKPRKPPGILITKVHVTKCPRTPSKPRPPHKQRPGGLFRSCPLTPVKVITWQPRRAIDLTQAFTLPLHVPRHHHCGAETHGIQLTSALDSRPSRCWW